jgi:competence protein ComEC
MSAIDIDAPAQTEVRTTAGIWLRDRALAERERWALWLPVCLGIGIGVYFRMTVEPPLWLGVAVASLLLGGVIALRRAGPAAVVLIALFTAAAGFALAELRCHLIATPMLDKSFGPAEIEGRVLGVDQTASGHRLLLDQLQVAGLPSAQTPARVRLSLRGAVDPVLVPGQHVRLRAMLRPASPPSAPGAFDFQRFLFFAGIGATGNAYAPIGLVPAAPGEAPDAAIRLARLRAAITARVLAVLPGDVGAVAAALVAGDETKISIPMQQAYRDSGLFHLLSISGLHIAIVAGFVMFLVRAGLALCEPIALRFPIKKWAALAALVAAGAYALLAGWTVPTQRSFLMSGLVLTALIIDRSGMWQQMPQLPGCRRAARAQNSRA